MKVLRQKVEQLCVLCGVNHADLTAVEHVPPRAIFTRPIPNNANLITVPACGKCNHGSSKDDQEFKACLSLAVGYSLPDQKKFWDNNNSPARRTLQKNKKLQRHIASSMREHEVLTPSGLYLGKAYTFPWSVENHNKVIEKITRGLFFHVTKEILAQNSKIEVSVYPQNVGFPKEITEMMNGCSDTKIISKCGSQFICQYGIANDVENASIWLYQFYESHFVMAVTRPPSAN